MNIQPVHRVTVKQRKTTPTKRHCHSAWLVGSRTKQTKTYSLAAHRIPIDPNSAGVKTTLTDMYAQRAACLLCMIEARPENTTSFLHGYRHLVGGQPYRTPNQSQHSPISASESALANQHSKISTCQPVLAYHHKLDIQGWPISSSPSVLANQHSPISASQPAIAIQHYYLAIQL